MHLFYSLMVLKINNICFKLLVWDDQKVGHWCAMTSRTLVTKSGQLSTGHLFLISRPLEVQMVHQKAMTATQVTSLSKKANWSV